MKENEITAEQTAKIIQLNTEYLEVLTTITIRLYADYQAGRLRYFQYSQRLNFWEKEYNQAKAIIEELTPKPVEVHESETV